MSNKILKNKEAGILCISRISASFCSYEDFMSVSCFSKTVAHDLHDEKRRDAGQEKQREKYAWNIQMQSPKNQVTEL